MPSPGIGKHRKGAPLARESAAMATSVGRVLTWRVQRADHEAHHAAAEAREESASEFAREIVDAATAATGEVQRVGDDYTYLSARFTHEQIEQISQAAGAAEIEPTVWIRLVTTPAGEVLLRQLQAAKRARRA